MDFVAVGERLRRIFEETGVEYAVIGGFALLAHGIERATFDLDFVTVRDCQDQLILALEQQGYETLHRSTGYSNHLHAEHDLGRVDFVYVDRATADQLIASAKQVEVLPGFEAKVPKPEHLAAMKVRALKNDPSREQQELADIRRLMELPGVDRSEIRRYFEGLELGHLFRRVDAGSE
jgi:hypothetical protein